jgi:hypothetical protein
MAILIVTPRLRAQWITSCSARQTARSEAASPNRALDFVMSLGVMCTIACEMTPVIEWLIGQSWRLVVFRSGKPSIAISEQEIPVGKVNNEHNLQRPLLRVYPSN